MQSLAVIRLCNCWTSYIIWEQNMYILHQTNQIKTLWPLSVSTLNSNKSKEEKINKCETETWQLSICSFPKNSTSLKFVFPWHISYISINEDLSVWQYICYTVHTLSGLCNVSIIIPLSKYYLQHLDDGLAICTIHELFSPKNINF